jgi:hypothetical protein
MIYELRQYRIKPGRMDETHRVFREQLIPVFEDLGIISIGYWEPVEAGEFDLHYLLAFENAEARERIWSEFYVHPAWLEIKAGFAGDPPYETTTATVLTPTDYSAAG